MNSIIKFYCIGCIFSYMGKRLLKYYLKLGVTGILKLESDKSMVEDNLNDSHVGR